MSNELLIYMDHHATTPVDPRVLETMLPFFKQNFGNASSFQHSYGWAAKQAVEKARKQVAEGLGALPREILFTSGATESVNFAFQQLLSNDGSAKNVHIVTSNVEHSSTRGCVERCRMLGAEITELAVDRYGQIHPEQVQAALRSNTRLVSLIFANNEIGTINPIGAIGEITRHHGVLFHVDAAQAFGKVPIDVEAMKIDLLSLSGHKIYAPKGIGALYARSRGEPRFYLKSHQVGGSQERGLRAGTLNVPGIVALGEAASLAHLSLDEERARLRQLRDFMQSRLLAIPGSFVNGHPEHRLENNLSLTLKGFPSETVLPHLQNLVAVSTGSACASHLAEPSHVLQAIGLSPELARSTLRFGLGRTNTIQECTRVCQGLIQALFPEERSSAIIEKWSRSDLQV